MAIKDLLVHFDLAPASEGRREAALALAEACGAHVTALCLIAEPILRSTPSRHLPADLVRDYVAQAERDLDSILATVTDRASRERGVRLTTRREIGSLDRLPHLLGLQGRYADLIIVGQPNLETGGVDDALVAEAAFMDTGRPALVVPYAGTRPLPPKRALLAWDGSREVARAAHDAIPLLSLAEAVIVLIVDARGLGGRLGQQAGSDIAAHLAHHGIEVALKPVESNGRAIGAVILEQAEGERIDLLVMGGYGHSRLREMMLGGTTRYLLEHTTTPILFSH